MDKLFSNNFNDSATRDILMQDFIDQYELYPDNISPISYSSSYDSVSPIPIDQDPNDIILTGETRIEYLGNIRVWELASAFLFISVFLLFVFFYVFKRIRRTSFEANEYSIIEKELIKGNKLAHNMPTLISAKLINYKQANNDSLKSSSLYNNSSIRNKSQTSQTTSTSTLPEFKAGEVFLSVNNLAFTNECLILDDENEMDNKQHNIKLEPMKNDSIV